MNAQSERRLVERHSVYLAATLIHGTGELAVLLRDLSRSGALVSSETLPAVGSRVAIVRNGLYLSARVMWKCRDRAGLQFRQRCEAGRLAHQPRPWPHPDLRWGGFRVPARATARRSRLRRRLFGNPG